MIFPDLPKRRNQFWTVSEPENMCSETPLHTEPQPIGVDIEAWFEQHGLPSRRTDPAAQSKNYQGDPIDWLARDAWELYLLVTVMIVWISYWYGVHRGTW